MYDDPLLLMFNFTNLPDRDQEVAAPFYQMARRLVVIIPKNRERTVALEELLKARNAAIRANVLGSPRCSGS